MEWKRDEYGDLRSDNGLYRIRKDTRRQLGVLYRYVLQFGPENRYEETLHGTLASAKAAAAKRDATIEKLIVGRG